MYTISSHMQNLLFHTLINSKKNNIFNKFIILWKSGDTCYLPYIQNDLLLILIAFLVTS